MRNNKGFSLVELIVVIAIMAILASVAVVGVSIYIPKAQEAADNELLNVLSDALVAACLSEGVDANTITAHIAVDENGKLAMNGSNIALDITYGVTADKEAKIVALFNEIFNDDTAFNLPKGTKVIADKTGRFVFASGPINSDHDWVYSKDIADIFAGSSYYNSDYPEDGIKELSGTIDDLAKALALAGGGGVVGSLKNDEGFKSTLNGLGIDPDKATDQELANASVFYVADMMSKLDQDEVYDLMSNPNGDLDGYLEQQGIAGNNQTFVKTALQYGMIQAYVNSEYCTDPDEKKHFEENTPTNSTEAAAFINYFTSKLNYQAYILDENDSQQSQKDMNAFFDIMGVASSNKGAFGSVSQEGLFSDDDVQKELQDILLSKGGN